MLWGHNLKISNSQNFVRHSAKNHGKIETAGRKSIDHSGKVVSSVIDVLTNIHNGFFMPFFVVGSEFDLVIKVINILCGEFLNI